jgi:hypothetical protein
MLNPEILEKSSEAQEWIFKKAIHCMNSFTFHPSTPHSLVSRILGHFFFTILDKPMSVMSTNGVLPLNRCRLIDPTMVEFIKRTPYIPFAIVDACTLLIDNLKSSNNLQLISFDDILDDLRGRVVTDQSEIRALLHWWHNYTTQNIVSPQGKNDFYNVVVIHLEEMKEPKPLKYFKRYINEKILPPDVPFPEDVIPNSVVRNLPLTVLKSMR